jgi:hypothetical protein
MFDLRYTFTFTYISFHSCALQYICANPFKALISCVHPLYALLSEPQMSHLLPYYKSQLLPIHHSEDRAQNPDPKMAAIPDRCGAAVVARDYDFHLFHVPDITHVFRSLMLLRFQRGTHALPVFNQSLHFGYSVSFLLSAGVVCACVRYLYRSCFSGAAHGSPQTGMVPHNTDHLYVRVIS